VSARLDAVRRGFIFSHFATRTVYNTVDLYAVYAAIFVQNRVFCLPYLYSTPPLGGLRSEYRHPVWHGKTRMAWLPDGEKISKISLFVLAQLTNVTDGQTDGHRMPAITALMHSIARQIPNIYGCLPLNSVGDSEKNRFDVHVSGSEKS